MQTKPSAPTKTSLPPVPTAKPKVAAPAPDTRVKAKPLVNLGAMPFWIGAVLSGLWTMMVISVVAGSGPTHVFGGLPLVDWAIGISAIVSPIALIWMVTAYLQRAADVQSIAEPLRRQLSLITGESGAAEARIRRFNQAIREQIELLKSAQGMTQGDLTAVMDRVRLHRDELERFEHASILQVKEVQDIVRRNMQQVEQLMDDKFTMLRVLDGKLLQNGDSVARQTESVRDQIAEMLQDMDQHCQQVTDQLSRAVSDSKKLQDMSRAQESTLVSAAENVSETLSGLSSKIDMSVARFLERTGTAREEAERLASALDAQTRSLDDFSSTLPTRVSEAESVIRGVADRLYSSEMMAREQAVSLSEKLSQQVDGLQSFMDRFTTRLSDIDHGLIQRRTELDMLAGRIGDTTGTFVDAWEQSIRTLNDRTGATLEKFTSLGATARDDANRLVGQLNETTIAYETATEKAGKISDESRARMKEMTQDIADQLSQFQSLSEATGKAGRDIETRATTAMHNLQNVLERLLAARDATQGIGETLVKDLYKAVDQNEQLISRLNDAAQMSVHALGIATQSLGKQEEEMTLQVRAADSEIKTVVQAMQQQAVTAERALRRQADELTLLLHETETRMGSTELKMQSLASTAVEPVRQAIQQIDISADQGLQSLSRYGAGLGEQLANLQRFHTEVGGMGDRLGVVTSETLTTIEQLNNRFIAVRSSQQETARQTLEQFAEFADRLHREVSGLEGQSAHAVTSLQQAAAGIGEQSYQMMQNAENGGAKLKMITTALQTEAGQIRATLQKQSDDLQAELTRAEKQFTSLTGSLEEHTQAVHILLDKAATSYQEQTEATATTMDQRAGRLQQITEDVIAKTYTLSTTLSDNVDGLQAGVAQLEQQAGQINQASGKAMQNLSSLNEKFTVTAETANATARQIATRLEETGTAFLRQSNALADASQSASGLVQKAGGAFAEQTGKLLDSSHHIDQQLRQLSTITTTYADQSAQIRNAMEQHNQRLVTELTQSVANIESASRKLDQTSTLAIEGAEKAGEIYTLMTDGATSRLKDSQQEIQNVATKAEGILNNFGAGVTQQSASLSLLSEQLAEQHKSMFAANENQRAQLVDLFDKLGGAHGEASDVAERTIARLSDQLGQIQRHLGSLSDQSQTAIGNVRTASTGFADQAAILIQNAQSAEQQARTVLTVTASLQEQARQLREAMQTESDRAGDMLGALLGKLGSGSVEIRNMASDSETSLSGLHNTLTDQAQSLTSTMQQISERQRTMTTALDAQRDVLNGLLSRLSLAQDETAAVAERSAARLTDGAQQIQRQSDAIETQARRAMEGVQASGQAFATDAAILIQNAQSAEQQARTVLTVTASLQEQARQLREAMQTESDRAGDMLGALLGKLGSGSVEIRNMASDSETSLSGLHNTLTDQAQSLTSTMQQISERQRTMTTALDAQRDVLNGLLSRLSLAQDETAAVAERSAARLTDGAQQIQRQSDAIETQARRAMEGVQASSQAFATDAATLIQNAQVAEQTAYKVMSATTALQEQTRQTSTTILDDADRTSESLSSLVTRIVSNSRELRDAGATTESALTALQAQVTEQTQGLTTAMQQISERQRGLAVALDGQRDVLNGLLNRLVLAQDETSASAERNAVRINESTQNVVRQNEIIEAQAKNALVSMQAAGTVFAEESGQLIQNAHQAEQQARAVLAATAAMHEQARQVLTDMHSEADRANDMLGSLMARISGGGRDLREMGANTEMTLGSLHNGVTTQSQELAQMMNVIGDRQRSLTTALDAQRDVLNGLLTRFSMAQDETAAVTERSAARMVDSAQQVARQAELIESKARNAETGVVAAGASFADQVGMLGLQAQQAEQHVRGVVSVTAGLQDQARQLREGMESETSRAVEQMNVAVAQLDATNNQLKLQSNTAVHAMDQTALQFATLAHTSAEAMHRQAEILSETAETAEERMARAGEKMRSHLKLVTEVGEQAEVQARQLADVAEYATGRLVTMRETINDSDHDGQNVLNQTAARIAEAKSLLQTELNNLSILSQQAIERVAAAAHGLSAQSDALRANLGMSESALSQAADLVREEAVRVPAMMDRSTSQIEQATRGLKDQTEEADTILVGTVDRFISVTMTARECMVDEMRRVSGTAEQADAILRQFSASLSEQMHAIQRNTAQMSDEQKELVAQADSSVAALSAASDRLAHLRSDATATAEKLVREFDTLDQRANTTGDRLAEAGETVLKNVDALSQVTQRAESQMMGASSQFRDQLERIRTGLQGQIDDINRGLMQITAQLERTGNTLRSTTAGTSADVERIAQRFDQTSKDAGVHLADKTARMRSATEEVAKLLGGFGDQLDVLLDRLALAGDGLRQQEGGLVEHLQKGLMHLGSISERLESSRALATDVTEATTTRLNEVINTLQREMHALTGNSQAAAGIIRGVGQIYSEQSTSLNKGVREAHGQVLEMNKSVEEMQQRTDRMRVGLKLQSQELMDSLQMILKQLSETGDTLGDTVDGVLRTQANANLKKIS